MEEKKYIELEGKYQELKVNYASMITLMTSSMSSLKTNMKTRFECFDEQSSLIIGERM